MAGSGIQLFYLPDTGISHQQLLDTETAQKLSSDGERLSALKEETAACLQASKGADIIICNLFTLEGYFIAQHLRIPCLVASPHILTRTPPSGFQRKLAEAYPSLFEKLKSAASNQVSYAEVEHWMWRLFLSDFGQACEAVGIPSVPLAAASQETHAQLPPPTPLLYGISPTVMARQSYWPESVSLSGFWTPPAMLHLSPDSALVSLVEAASSPLVYVGFGSMERYLLDVSWEGFFQALESALESCSMEAIFQCTQDGSIAQAFAQLSVRPKRAHLWTSPTPHQWLFPRCSVILHHGGSGTVATALLAQRPQIICPVMFDQSFWAEHLSWKGLAYQCPHVRELSARQLTHAINVVLGAAVRKCVADLGAALSAEDGVKAVLSEIEKLLVMTQK